MGQGAAIFGCADTALGPEERAFFKQSDPWGFILFARNVDTPDQLRRLTGDLRDAVGRNAPILIDQEGGRVARMRGPHWTEWLPPLDQVAANPANATRSMYLRYRLIAAELLAVGIDVNCAPCADVAHADTHPVLHNRCYGDDAATVTKVAKAVAAAHLDSGVLPVIKHMPGHGQATSDSHHDLPHVTAPADDLEQRDFAPFRALADLPMGMSAHIVFETFGETGPATTSPAMIHRIRDDIGFGGLLMTDDLSMNALSGTVAQRSRAALDAGIDVILHCNGDLAEMRSVAETAGEMTEIAQSRADAALQHRKPPAPIDIDEATAELNALLGVRLDG
ncbi:glycoside hydrolase family 3 N-terminal domain-containing protein [Aliiroseovarius sp. YM-037]|uniref:glycoside hydrolase family 3 N-terminal domain-containing protein n=1 Tax=Aliiroseovarius sp. YM-037 TaxID=3341728 RepID=UPI003A7FEF3E